MKIKKSRPYSPRQKPAIRGVDETPEEFRSLITEVMHHKVLGETSEAVKPCLEEYEKDVRKLGIGLSFPEQYQDTKTVLIY